MTPTLNLIGGDTLVVSPTQLELIRTCARMWLYRYLYRRVPAQTNEAAQGGKAFDSALNLRYTKCGAEPVDAATELEMHGLIDRAYEGVEMPLEEWRTPARYKSVITDYNQHWHRESFRILGVQVPFAVELGSIEIPEATSLDGGVSFYEHTRVRVIIHGLLDLLAQVGDHVMVIDTKTSKSDLNGGSYENSAQMKAYMWGMQELSRQNPGLGLPETVHAAMINGVVIRPPYKNPGRAPGASDKPRNDFQRTFPCFYTSERLEEWRRDTLLHVETALGWVARDHFPQNERHCTFHVDAAFTSYGYYGKPCPYLQVCSLPEAQRASMLGSDTYMDYESGPIGPLREPPKEATTESADAPPASGAH